jgi:hypothetical protein
MAEMFSYVQLEDGVPQGHPLRAIRGLVDPILRELSPRSMRGRAGRRLRRSTC